MSVFLARLKFKTSVTAEPIGLYASEYIAVCTDTFINKNIYLSNNLLLYPGKEGTLGCLFH